MLSKEDHNYSEYVAGGIGGKPRNVVLSMSDLIKRLKENNQIGCYRNHFRFTADYKTYIEKHNGPKGYKGSVYSDMLWLDFDRKPEELDLTVEAVKTFLNRMLHEYQIPSDHLRCYFSGRKGFHIGIPAEIFGLIPSQDLPGICKDLAIRLAGDLCIDKTIYDKTRLFRLSNTKHEISDLYKIELHPSEILNCADSETILELAKEPRILNREYDPSDSESILSSLLVDVQGGGNDAQKEEARKVTEKWLSNLLTNGATVGGRTDAEILQSELTFLQQYL